MFQKEEQDPDNLVQSLKVMIVSPMKIQLLKLLLDLNYKVLKIKVYKFKGKMSELFENEIKVLRTCKNKNIIKLIDLKKT